MCIRDRGYSLIYKASGLMTFAQGDLLTVGAFLGVTFFNGYHLPFVVSLLLSVLIAFFIGLGVEKFIIRRLLNKKVMAIYIVLATIAISYIIQNGTMIGFGTKTLYFPAIFPFKTVKLGTISVQTESLVCIPVSYTHLVSGSEIFPCCPRADGTVRLQRLHHLLQRALRLPVPHAQQMRSMYDTQY